MKKRFDEIRRTDSICGGMYSCVNSEYNSLSPLCKECLMDMEKALEDTDHVEDTTTNIQQDHK